MAIDRAGADWRTSSYSGANGDCVEVATTPAGEVAVRDSKDRSGPALRFSAASWQAFVAGVREGGPAAGIPGARALGPAQGTGITVHADPSQRTANGRP